MKVKKARELTALLLCAGALIMLLGSMSEALFIVGVIVTFSRLILHFLNNKCPHYGKQLGKSGGNYCQFCGEQLDRED